MMVVMVMVEVAIAVSAVAVVYFWINKMGSTIQALQPNCMHYLCSASTVCFSVV
jgi:hypothetical protein